MPRPNRSYGRPGTEVIPADWETSHAPIAAKTMTGVAALRLPGVTMAWSDAEQRTVPTPHAPYATGVPVRVQAHRETAVDRAADVADQTIEVAGYLVTLPRGDAGADQIAPGHLIDITSSSDPLAAGVTFRVIELVLGTLRFERDVFAVVNDQTDQTTGGA